MELTKLFSFNRSRRDVTRVHPAKDLVIVVMRRSF